MAVDAEIAGDGPRPAGSLAKTEPLAVCALFGAVALVVAVTYARLPAEDLYNTSVEGVRGGLGRALVFLNFPAALAAIGVALVAVDGRGKVALAAAWTAVPLCAIVTVPGVVEQEDLDAKPVNVVPLAGVVIAAALAAQASRGTPRLRRPAHGDRARVIAASVLLVLAIPWLFAELGFYAPDPILADEIPTGVAPEQQTLAAVHLGHHHGTDGVLLALAALALSRTLGTFRQRRLEAVASAYLALMLTYGIANALQDFALEQVYKRGWIDAAPPSVLRPELSGAWLAVVAAAVAVELGWFRRARRERE